MNDLAHFVPLKDSVTLRGKKYPVTGVDIEDLGQIFFRYPEIVDMLQKKQFDATKVGISKGAICALCAAGLGHAGDEAIEKSLANLALGERAELFGKVFKLTAPGGIGPFSELVVAMNGGAETVEAAPVRPKRTARLLRSR